jgi:hypothetical protein
MADRKDSSSAHEDSMSSTSDFVKKLYKLRSSLLISDRR